MNSPEHEQDRSYEEMLGEVSSRLRHNPWQREIFARLFMSPLGAVTYHSLNDSWTNPHPHAIHEKNHVGPRLKNAIEYLNYSIVFSRSLPYGFGIVSKKFDLKSQKKEFERRLETQLKNEFMSELQDGHYENSPQTPINPTHHLIIPDKHKQILPSPHPAFILSNDQKTNINQIDIILLTSDEQHALAFELARHGGYVDHLMIAHTLGKTIEPRSIEHLVPLFNMELNQLGISNALKSLKSAGTVGYAIEGNPRRRISAIQQWTRKNFGLNDMEVRATLQKLSENDEAFWYTNIPRPMHQQDWFILDIQNMRTHAPQIDNFLFEPHNSKLLICTNHIGVVAVEIGQEDATRIIAPKYDRYDRKQAKRLMEKLEIRGYIYNMSVDENIENAIIPTPIIRNY